MKRIAISIALGLLVLLIGLGFYFQPIRMALYKGKPPGYAEPAEHEFVLRIQMHPCNNAPLCDDSERINAALLDCVRSHLRCEVGFGHEKYFLSETLTLPSAHITMRDGTFLADRLQAHKSLFEVRP